MQEAIKGEAEGVLEVHWDAMQQQTHVWVHTHTTVWYICGHPILHQLRTQVQMYTIWVEGECSAAVSLSYTWQTGRQAQAHGMAGKEEKRSERRNASVPQRNVRRSANQQRLYHCTAVPLYPQLYVAPGQTSGTDTRTLQPLSGACLGCTIPVLRTSLSRRAATLPFRFHQTPPPQRRRSPAAAVLRPPVLSLSCSATYMYHIDTVPLHWFVLFVLICTSRHWLVNAILESTYALPWETKGQAPTTTTSIKRKSDTHDDLDIDSFRHQCIVDARLLYCLCYAPSNLLHANEKCMHPRTYPCTTTHSFTPVIVIRISVFKNILSDHLIPPPPLQPDCGQKFMTFRKTDLFSTALPLTSRYPCAFGLCMRYMLNASQFGE